MNLLTSEVIVPTKRRILVVDDVSTVRSLMRDVLARWGYAVESAESGDVALRLAADQRFDLAILDIVLGDMDGFELCDQLRSLPGNHSLPVLFISGIPAEDVVRRARATGRARFIAKPPDYRQLVEDIQQLFSA